MPTRTHERNIVQQATSAALEYAEASDRVIAIVDRLGDVHTKLTQCRAQRDERLLSAVTAWHSLDATDQGRLRALVQMVNHPTAEKLLTSIVKQHGVTSGDASQDRKTVGERRDDSNSMS